VGTSGVRWRQVAVIVVGTWLSAGGPAQLPTLAGFGAESNTNVADALLYFVSPFLFVFSAITAVRSFQSSLAIVVSSALLHSLLSTGIRVAMWLGWGDLLGQNTLPGQDLLRVGATAFSWMTFSMCALHYSVAGEHRWTRMTRGLCAAFLAQSLVVAALYLGLTDLVQWIGYVAISAMASIFFAWIWTFTFRFGLRQAGG